MNLWIRLLLILALGWRRSRMLVTECCSTPFIVMPSDIDLLGHVNNGKYFSLMDVARTDHAIRSGYVSIFRRQAWWPVVVAGTIQFYSSLLPFRRFVIETRLIGWDERTFFVHHRVVRNDANRKLVAQAAVRAVIRNSAGTIATADVVAALGNIVPPEPMPDWIAGWARSLDQVRLEHKREVV
ncbi:acyl-CoA thioesterase [Povalibacter sp.]|uniref:acyl-CoA thioesterase n=1 Tax=Povalibacter sp. TaxID=1962978 RepID=UPI002F4181EC